MAFHADKLKVLMFGWEFPPFNSGGLGVACKGLTRGLVNRGVEVIFVLPKVHGILNEEYMRILSAEGYGDVCGKIKFRMIDSLLKPYATSKKYASDLSGLEAFSSEARNIYGSDLFSEVRRYAVYAKAIALQEDYDVIHCHDWLTYPAGIAAKHMAELRGIHAPLIVHVHATEFDRTVGHPNQYVYDIERMGMNIADRVITVSEYTKDMVVRHYGVDPAKVCVVHNAVDYAPPSGYLQHKLKEHYKVVLFLGRVTIQKGPDHFLKIAKRISEKDDNVRFIMVGSGDMFTRIVEEAAKMGIGDRVLFSDFLSGKDVERAYKMADVYVMSSVSEPFGLTALEAAQSGTPVVVSKQSGVCEVLKNCLVADFWDVEMMANKILSILNNPEFKKHLSTEGMKETMQLNWDNAASKCVEVYCNLKGGA
jgi:glycosyltransferase involved in cell wall biosynthesis